ncbi:MAG: nucleotide sugar dehydrogenase [Candidatus Moranbacteria bacterium]|nr:nucleotide sugar dehydrogenase [Candidatus Moranbacteria bacterium]MDD3965116.1 nucleotide sugar dehydrogenase [Candidatus Moranbacteria bacterium]
MANYDLKTVAVIGLGYVGLPLAVRSQERGYTVIGFDLNKEKIKTLQSGKHIWKDAYLEANIPKYPFRATSDPSDIAPADIHIICVPTPVDSAHHPDLGPVIGACEIVATQAKKGALVVLESTVNPYVSEEVVRPIFEQHGFVIGKDIFISHCPERINPGDPKWNVTNIPRVVGSFEKKGLEMSLQFYRSIVDADIRPMKTIREAEAVKILENSFRNVNIAFVNEIARSFDKLDIDVKDVINGAATKPFAFMAHYPSCGIGGHCIPVDPHYLVERAKASGFDHEFLKLAIKTNNEMPEYTVERLQDALNENKMPMKGTVVGVLGLSYKANVEDIRESPSFEIIKHLKKHYSKVETFDPYVKSDSSMKSLEAILKKSQAIIVATNHQVFIETITPTLLKKHGIKVIIDGKNCLDRNAFQKAGIIYKGIGR